jgi:acetolactate synthase I/II/III large subunit
MVSGGQLLVQALAVHGVSRVFTVAGESYLPVLDALLDHPGIEVVTCRQESGVTFMAEAHARLTGEPGIAFVTRGPGACNASIGIHTARQSSAPVIMFAGLISTADRDREAFQEFDLPQMFGSLSKWAAVIDRIERVPEYVTRAFHIARSGQPGPVVLGLPEDVLFGMAADAQAAVIRISEKKPHERDLTALTDLLNGSNKPLILAGGGGWSDQACADLAGFSSATHIPVSCALRSQDIFNHAHGNYIGELGTSANPALVNRFKEADTILILGARPDEITTQSYTLLQPGQKIIHVYPDVGAFGQACTPDLAIQADMAPMAAALAGHAKPDGRRWAGWRDEARRDYLSWSDLQPRDLPWNGADMSEIFRQLRDALPDDAIITTDAGNFSGWCQRYIRYGRPGRLLAPVSGAMGYGVPSAIAASLQHPDKTVIGFCGDGGFMMTGHELATAVHHKAKPIIFVCNNSMYGTIRMHQERTYPGRVSATGLTNPDFVKLGESYGVFAARIEHANQFAAVWEKVRSADTAALIEISMDPRQITTNLKI